MSGGKIVEGKGDWDGNTIDGVTYPDLTIMLAVDCYRCGARGLWPIERWKSAALAATGGKQPARVVHVDVSDPPATI